MADKRTHDDSIDGNEHDGEETFSMVDILAEQNELEESASAVLGGSDDKNCTYLQGYVSRQALYSCKTCSVASGDGHAGVCLACCLECHDGHELIELYTKRNFRCDCGNSKFPSTFSCKLIPKRFPVNDDNAYNQNFSGAYCTCHKPYPDPDDKIEDEMIQCSVCEDWFHGRHLGSPLPEEYAEMICDTCMVKADFLWTYSCPFDDVTVDTDCVLVSFKKKLDGKKKKGACFFKSGWRAKLCTCEKCKILYDEQKISFLTDESDSVEAYEEKGKSGKSQYEKGMEELSKLDRVQQVEVMSEYNDLKTDLKDYLAEFATSGEVVTKEHIAQFFEQMKNKKRRRIVVPSSCR